MRRLVILLLFTGVLGLTILVNTPLGFVLDRAGLKNMNIGWAKVDGTLMKGRISGVYVQYQPLGDVSLTLRPASLWSLKPAYDVQWGGAGGRGTAVVNLSRSALEGRDIRAEQQISALEGLNNTVRAFGGVVRLQNGAFRLTRSGCQQAEGVLSTDLISKVASEYGVSFSTLSGPVKCRDGRLWIDLLSASPSGDQVSIMMNSGLMGDAAFEMRVETADTAIALALSSFGFQLQDEKWVYRYQL